MQRNNTTLSGPSKQKSVMLLLFAFLANSFNLSQALKRQVYFYLRKKLISHIGICSERQGFTPLHLHTSTHTNTRKGVYSIGHWFIRPTVNPHGLGPISTHQESAQCSLQGKNNTYRLGIAIISCNIFSTSVNLLFKNIQDLLLYYF